MVAKEIGPSDFTWDIQMDIATGYATGSANR